MSDRVFPIKTDTSCPLKWNWTTLYLNSGTTASCHRTAYSELTPENFFNFHNTEIKQNDRRDMLAGHWPEKNCQYCKVVEDSGGISDRMRHWTIPYSVPPELESDSAAVVISPTVLEVYFNNTCNLGCLYCSPELSSFISAENQKHGEFQSGTIWLKNVQPHYKNLIPYFWQWFPEGFSTISRFHILGGEPFYQRELESLLDMIEKYPNPKCELNIVSNLTVSTQVLSKFVSRFKSLLATRKLRRIDITCSIDCWGPQQEYVRWPMDLTQWGKNFEFLLAEKYLYLNINQTISALTIKTMPILLEKLKQWRKIRRVGHWFSEVSPGPDYLKPHILGGKIFESDFESILNLMPEDSDENINGKEYMRGIAKHVASSDIHYDLVQDLLVFLDEKDRRRNTDWKSVFPWLKEFQKYVV